MNIHKWKRDEVRNLIYLWSENIKKLKGSKKNGLIYHEIATTLNKIHFISITGKDVNTKISNMKKQYRIQKKKRSSCCKPSLWWAFDFIDKVYGSYPVNDSALDSESIPNSQQNNIKEKTNHFEKNEKLKKSETNIKFDVEVKEEMIETYVEGFCDEENSSSDSLKLQKQINETSINNSSSVDPDLPEFNIGHIFKTKRKENATKDECNVKKVNDWKVKKKGVLEESTSDRIYILTEDDTSESAEEIAAGPSNISIQSVHIEIEDPLLNSTSVSSIADGHSGGDEDDIENCSSLAKEPPHKSRRLEVKERHNTPSNVEDNFVQSSRQFNLEMAYKERKMAYREREMAYKERKMAYKERKMVYRERKMAYREKEMAYIERRENPTVS